MQAGKSKAKTKAKAKRVAHVKPGKLDKAGGKLNVPTREECHELFNRFDNNGNGILSLAEVDKAGSFCAPRPTRVLFVCMA